MYLVRTTRKKVLTNLLRKTGFEVLPTRFADMIICPQKPPVMYEENGYIRGIEFISEKLAADFYGPPVEHPKERDLVHVKNNGEELMGTVHEVKDNTVVVMVKVLHQPRLIEVDQEDIIPQGS